MPLGPTSRCVRKPSGRSPDSWCGTAARSGGGVSALRWPPSNAREGGSILLFFRLAAQSPYAEATSTARPTTPHRPSDTARPTPLAARVSGRMTLRGAAVTLRATAPPTVGCCYPRGSRRCCPSLRRRGSTSASMRLPAPVTVRMTLRRAPVTVRVTGSTDRGRQLIRAAVACAAQACVAAARRVPLCGCWRPVTVRMTLRRVAVTVRVTAPPIADGG